MALVKSIVFVDGENLTCRYQAMMSDGRKPKSNVIHIPNVFVWQPNFGRPVIDTDVIRINYYTSMVGDEVKLANTKRDIAAVSYDGSGDYYGPCQLTPRIFKKSNQSHKSRLVDINIAIDIMRHAYTGAIDVVYLFRGDGDFTELVDEIARSGKRICVAAFSSGLDSRLPVMADRFYDLDQLYFEAEACGANA